MVEQSASKSAAGARNKSMKQKSKVKAPPTPLTPPEKKKKKKKKKKQSAEAPPPESPCYSSAPSICKQVVDKAGTPPATEERRASVSGVKKPLSEVSTNSNSNSKQLLLQRGGSSSFRTGVQLRRLSGCYECHMVVDPITSSICPCPDCGEIFVSQDSLQLHQSVTHAVCELGSDDTSRNIIEIIFQSSWLKKQSPVCRIERILKVHNTPRTLARFEDYREAVKAKAKNASKNKHHYPRCTADGNELLRFHCAALACQLGLNGATHLCTAATCATCAIIRHGFKPSDPNNGIRTMATSGRAHDDDQSSSSNMARAMLVCRVIAGRVKRPSSNSSHHHDDDEEEEVQQQEEFESIAGSAGLYSNMEELQVFNPRAILPCFVVIYNAAS